MESKNFIPSTQKNTIEKKPTDYWGMLFISLIFVASISCFLFANHSDHTPNNLSILPHQISGTLIDLDQNSKR